MTAAAVSRRHHRACNLCEAMCGVVVEHDGRRVLAVDGDPDDPLSRGHLCTKAQALAEVYEDPDRLRRPQAREGARGGDAWREAGWEEALDQAADRLAAIAAEHGRDSVALYVGNPTVHDYGAMIGSSLLAAALGTANRYSATSVDQLPRHFVSRLLYGHQGLLPVPDVDRTGFFLVVGANPLASNGSLMSAPGIGRRLKALQERGGKLVVLDPRRTETAARADRHLFVRPGTDALLLAAMLEVLFAEQRVRPGRLGERLDGLDELAAIARRFPPERVAAATGVPAEEIRRLARELAEAPAAAPYGRVGACTQRFGGLTTWLLDCLALLTGNLDRPGGLMFARPAVDLAHPRLGVGRGEIGERHSRVRGLASFDGQFPAVALAEEIDTPGQSQGPGRVRALVTLAGNPVLSLPDGRRLERALGGLDFMVSIDIYRNETTRWADLILPPAHALEQDHYDLALHLVAVRNTARYSPALFAPGPGTRTSWQVLSALAERLERRRGGAAALAAAVKHRLLGRLGPRGVLGLGLRLGPYGRGLKPFGRGLDLAALEAAPHGVDLGPLEPCLPERLQTPGRRIPLVPAELAADLPRLEAALEGGGDPGADGGANGLVLIGRRHVKDNNSWLHNVPRLMRGPDRSALWLHPDDAAARGLAAGDRARLTTRTGSAEATVHVTDRIMPGVASLPHGYGHARPGTRLTVANRHPGTPLNDLTDTTLYDHLTGNAALNGTPVTVESLHRERSARGDV